jgi:hypothetical protein
MLTIGYKILEKPRKQAKGQSWEFFASIPSFTDTNLFHIYIPTPYLYSFLGLFVTPYLFLKVPLVGFFFSIL